MLEVFNNLFMNVQQMGLRLQNTAYSVNVKEARLDFSCALFDAQRVHRRRHMPCAWSMAASTVIARNPAMRDGDVYMLNDPYHGGTHLPDVTVVTPVYLDGPAPSDGAGRGGGGRHRAATRE